MGDTNTTNSTTDTNTAIISSARSASGESGGDQDPPPRARFRRVLAAEPAALSLLRREFRRWLERMHWPDDDAADLVMALNEAVANVIDHAYQANTGTPPGDVRVLAELINGRDQSHDQSHDEGYRVRVTVTDSGRWRPIPTDPGHRGRGLRMMRACNAWLGVDPGPNGTRVTMISRPCHPRVLRVPCLTAPTSSAGRHQPPGGGQRQHILDHYRDQRRSA